MYKKNYNNAEIEILYFERKDVITASSTDPAGGKDDSSFTPDNYIYNSPLAE